MRRAARVDRHHAEIVDALRGIGASVLSLAAIGRGCPDLLVGWGGNRNLLLEVKNPAGPRGGTSEKGQKLSPDQVLFHARWNGPIAVVRTVDEAIQAVLSRKSSGAGGRRE